MSERTNSGASGASPMAMVTGGSRGLGLEVARALAGAGFSLALVARDQGALREAAASLAAGGQRVWTRAADLANLSEVEAAFREAIEEFGRIDVLVNNAAIQGPIGPLHAVDFEGWQKAVAVNLLAPARLCQLAAGVMRDRGGGGKIINISGGGATNARPDFSAYAASKCGLVRLTETIAAELQPDRIDVNAVAPGPMNTRMLEEVIAAGPAAAKREFAEALRRRDTGGTPLARACELIAFLASASSNGITGRLISAVWDDWRTLRADQLAGSDLYTLRRVSPKR